MRINLLQGYRGRLTNNVYYEAGEHDIDITLASYLIENGYAESIPTQETKPVQIPVQIEDDLQSMTVSELKAYANRNGIELDDNMRKAQILSAIEDAF